MITREQYDKINEGDTVTVERTCDGLAYRITGEVYKGGTGLKCVGDKNLYPDLGGYTATLIEHIRVTRAWHDAIVITATSADHKGSREVFKNVTSGTHPWRDAKSGHYYRHDQLHNVKILVDKDVEL